MSTEPLAIAVVGCGAVAGAHLPIIAESKHARTVMTVDQRIERAKELARAHGVPDAEADFRALIGRADAAIVALPHHLHAPVSTELLENGIHVLVEKPMALTTDDCDAMIAAARGSGATLAVGQLRRFFYSSRFIKNALEQGVLGEVTSFDMREGTIYNWPAASDFTFRADAGGGVLADQGAHALDVLLWWLGDAVEVAYHDDAEGGVEADCELRLRLASGARGIVELSRTRNLRSTVILRGTRATLEVESKFDSHVRLCVAGQDIVLDGRTMRDADPDEDVTDIFRRQLADFVDAIRTGREPLVSGTEARRAVAVIERCRAGRQRLALPWASWTPPT